ncbi:MAG: PQ-loop repeat-containing protein [Candidatus Aenigmarchaeota archaeon]|nr:PQ-loop repeat-containing protein [Candidatus Aenigmarchaeota archaeon]
MPEWVSFFGLLGSITAASLFFPQVYTAWRTKKTHDLSWLMIVIGMSNGFFWVIYGLFKTEPDPFIYVTNAFLFTATAMLAFLKKRYG